MANTKLLLIEDVEGLGRSGDIVSVRPGFARNFLLPQQMALLADKSALRMQTRLQEERRQKAVQDKKESDELGLQIEGKVLTKIVKVDHEGHMYGSVSVVDVVHLFQEQENLAVEKRFVLLKHPLKETGVFPLQVRLKEGVNAAFTLKIVPEGAEEAAAEGTKG